jgi:hypothetical protein
MYKNCTALMQKVSASDAFAPTGDRLSTDNKTGARQKREKERERGKKRERERGREKAPVMEFG